MEKEKIFALIRGIASDTNTVSDRTINEAIADWSDSAPSENAEVYWTKLANSLKKTIAGQVSAVAKAIDDKRQAEALALKAEKERLEKELEDARKGVPPVNPPVPPVPPVATELPEEYKKKMEEYEKFMADQKKKEEEGQMQHKAEQRKKRIIDAARDSKNGMLNSTILNPILKYADFSKDMTDDEYISHIQREYNENLKEAVKTGYVPNIANIGGKSITEEQEKAIIEESAKKARAKFPQT